MDEWYVQTGLTRKKAKISGTSMNPLFEQMNFADRAVTSLDQHWDVDSAADDNEAYSIEQE